jgi:hypothetical protein
MKPTLLAIAVSRSGSIVFMKKAENTSNDASQPASTIHIAVSFLPLAAGQAR